MTKFVFEKIVEKHKQKNEEEKKCFEITLTSCVVVRAFNMFSYHIPIAILMLITFLHCYTQQFIYLFFEEIK